MVNYCYAIEKGDKLGQGRDYGWSPKSSTIYDNDNDVYFTLATSDSRIGKYKTAGEQLTHIISQTIQNTFNSVTPHHTKPSESLTMVDFC